MEKVILSSKEQDRQAVIKSLMAGNINAKEASVQLHLSVRHTVRLKRKVEKNGLAGLAHQSRGKRSNHRISEDEEKLIADLVEEKYLDFTPTFAAEKLSELHRITHDPKTITRVLSATGVWQKNKIKRKQKQLHRSWRQRRSSFGELIQFDGSYEYWLEDRGATGRMCLLAGIDDATGKITKAKFAEHEGVLPVCSFWQEYCIATGKPVAIYLDKFSTYNINHQLAKENGDTLTQFERACAELRIGLIKANSPQAKGRVERLFHTLQDRLIKELRLANISTIEEANIFLTSVFIPKFNERFSVIPVSDADVHRELSHQEKKQLPSILSRQTKRIVQNDFTVSFNKQFYQLDKDGQSVTICKKDSVIVEERIDRSIHLTLKGKELNFHLLPARPIKQSHIPWVIAAGQKPNPNPYGYDSLKAHKPAPNHPWRTYRLSVKNR